MHYIRVLSLLLFTNLTIAFAQGENLFDDTILHTIHFNNVDTTLIDGSKLYQPVQMIFDNAMVDSIGLREKGNISNNVPHLKVPFKIKTNKYVSGREYDGIREFTLHNNFQDPSMMREKITYDICEQLGLFSLRTAYARVYIDGIYWGLYTIVEGKDEMYKQRFDNRDADAIESLDFGDMCFISNNPDDYNYAVAGLPYYQLDNGDEGRAFARFATMIDIANHTADPQYISTVSQHLNLSHFFTYQAINVYLMNMDSYIAFRGNQIYMYDDTTNIFQVIPWDFNASLGLWDTNNSSPASYPLIPTVISSGCIAGRLNTVPELEEYYLETMCTLTEICAPAVINPVIDGWKTQISQAVYDDTRKTFTNQDFDQALETGYFQHNFENVPALKTFFAERFDVISQELAATNFICNATGITESETTPESYFLAQNFPNPFNATTQISYRLKAGGHVTLKLYDVTGAEYLQLVNKFQGAGEYKVELDASSLASGLYFYRLQINGFAKARRMLLIN